MKTKIFFVIVLTLSPISMGAQWIHINGEYEPEVILEVGQSCTFEIYSDDDSPYVDYLWVSPDGADMGDFTLLSIESEAGSDADALAYNEPGMDYAYELLVIGSSPPPVPGIHFTFEFEALQEGSAMLWLRDEFKNLTGEPVSLEVVRAPAEPLGSSFTYQGQLYDANQLADGLYDFQFKLYDADSGDYQVGCDVNVPDVDIIDGYFTVELDFGNSVFDGNARWLEIGVRPGEQNDPNVYTSLSPRQQITQTPYASYAKSVENGIIGSGTTNYLPKFTDSGTMADSIIYQSGDYIGIGLTNPSADLTVYGSTGQIRIYNPKTGTDYDGLVLGFITDNSKDALIWNRENAYLKFGTNDMERMRITAEGKVGIGTDSPSYDLDVAGDIRATGTIYGTITGTIDNADKLDGYHETAFFQLSQDETVTGRPSFNGGVSGSSPPFYVDSTSKITNLNADHLDGYDKTAFFQLSQDETVMGRPSFNGGTSGTNSPFNVDSTFKVTNLNADLLDGYDSSGFVRQNQSDSISSAMIVNNTITASDIAANAVYSSKIIDGGVFTSDLASGAVTTDKISSSGGGSGAALVWGSAHAKWGHPTASDLILPYSGSVVTPDEPGIEVIQTGFGGIALRADSTSLGIDSWGADCGIFGEGGRAGVRALCEPAGSDEYHGVYADCKGGSGSNYGIEAWAEDGDENYAVCGHASGGTTNYAGYFEGDVHVIGNITYTGSISDVSDIRLKENIVPLEDGIEKISALKGIYFNNKGQSPDDREVGVIAQDVEKVLPELVLTNSEGYKSVDYTKLSAVLVEAVKEQQKQIEALQAEISRLNEKLENY